ncbi:MFS transporter [Gulosibacter bifidus]|uniref:Nitrate/nitrite transporter n=1 Tax=Gulosibacter bifidus TaxID=272239 RepID=A0ABW5RHL0_9MICO|nr:MFS transporter [Gulosibacter bifidus]
MDPQVPNTQVLATIPRRLPGIMFALALLAYAFAVTQRTSLGVAGLEAQSRWDASATALSGLALLQIVVYALAQIPVGMMLDRFGPSRLIIGGALLMGAGQLIVALAPTIEVATGGRVLLGLGDATTFVSALRLVSAWFRPRKVPVMQQWLANGGQFGQFLSAVPFAMLLHLTAWETAFISVAAISFIVAVIGIAAFKDAPGTRFESNPVSLREAFAKLGAAFARPGTRLGYWSHFTLLFPGLVFGLLWGFPLMVQGLGIDERVAAAFLLIPVLSGVVIGPVLGILTARFPLRRSTLVMSISVVVALFWIGVIMWPGQPPLWFFLLTLIITGLGSTGSTIGFDFARTFNPTSSYGSASGIVNVGGFTSGSIALLMIGLLLDAVTHGSTPDWAAFRIAFWAVPITIGIGILGVWDSRHRTRALAAEEGVVVAPLWGVIARRWRRRTNEP